MSEKEAIERAFAAIDALVENRTPDREVGGVSGNKSEAKPEPVTVPAPEPPALTAALTAAESGTVPPLEAWPESLADRAGAGAQTGDAEAARQEVWLSWCEWKARELNRIFNEHGCRGISRDASGITAATVTDGMEKHCRRRKA